jgi:general secretion pathway protein A
MYNSYFGFREKPFKLVPNPEYLFLSKSHEIALAHLTYATEQGEGFVVITGEVGTGKTTLCRNYLDGLDASTSSAYIFNPKLEPAQLLASICQEFGINTGKTTIKALLDLLNNFLIEQNAVGNKVVVLIDEAQGLSVENLELIRMLSNLETTRSKLLQIILVGQPELGDQLDSYELRQLSQRISLSYHLSPLSARESEAYIQHRLGIATQRQADLFTANACRSAYHYSGGIPRLINIVCDRALLLAYSHNRPKVNRTIMQAAIRELLSRGQAQPAKRSRPLLIGGAALLFVATIIIVAIIWRERPPNKPQAQVIPSGGVVVGKVPPVDPAPSAPDAISAVPTGKTTGEAVASDQGNSRIDKPALPPVSGPNGQIAKADVPGKASTVDASQAIEAVQPSVPAVASLPAVFGQSASEPSATASGPAATGEMGWQEATPEPQTGNLDNALPPLAAVIDGLDAHSSCKKAVQKLLTLWGQPRPNVDLLPQPLSDPLFIELAARQYELRAYAAPWRWDLVEQLDLPVILTLKHPSSGDLVYLTLMGINGDNLRLSAGENTRFIETSKRALEPHLAEQMYVFWRNVLGFDMIIGYGANKRAVLGIQDLLRKIGYDTVSLSSVFDAPTKAAIQSFQREKGIKADGLIGPLTKMMLLKAAGTEKMPRLNDGKKADS